MYRQLLPGDVAMKGGQPLWIVVECDPQNNRFAWLGLQNYRAGKVFRPDFDKHGMWDDWIFFDYDEIQRGDVSYRDIQDHESTEG